jgi:polyphosphate kinase
VIEALYRASRAGVEIDLIVRGGCALRPGVRGLSQHIRVRSIIGRFLEHSRIFYFENGGDPDLYLGSADWMPRNLYERVEVMFPVRDPVLQHRVVEILGHYLKDTAKSRMLHASGQYVRAHHGDVARAARNGARNGSNGARGARFSVQDFFIELPEAMDAGGAESARVPLPMSAD